MKIIVGLGNPGPKYQNNRHNIGHMMIDYMADQVQSAKFKVQSCNLKLKIFKTDCFMNLSGQAVKKIIKNCRLKIENLIVVHDDLDIPLGKFKIQKGTGPLLHNGIESIEKTLGTKAFWRVRIGIDNRLPKKTAYLIHDRGSDKQSAKWIDGESYVLIDFTPEERKTINQSFPKIFSRLQTDFLK